MEVRLNFSRFDGTGRTPRPVQKQFLDWLAENWNEADVFAGQLSVGSGKSALARALQIATGAHVITPSNVLIEQYMATYPRNNFLMGKARYSCFWGVSCSERVDVMEQPACAECPYQKCRSRAHTEPTFFNPLSLFYFKMQMKERPKVLVVDEAHQLSSMILMLCEKKFRRSMYRWTDKCLSEIYLLEWMREQIRKLEKLSLVYEKAKDAKGRKKFSEITGELESLRIVSTTLADDPGNYAIYTENGKYRGKPETFLVVRPVRPPKLVVRRILDCGKILILSGTLLPTDIEDLAVDRTVRFIDLPSPIPKEQRPILYRPVSFAMNYKTDPKQIVDAIERVLDEFPNRNTIVHVSYALSAKLFPHFKRPVLHNTSENKTEVLERFKRTGGVFLAAGCAEGIDLKDDLCRLNIIPQLMFPNLSDVVVQKRKAQEGGEDWYGLETMKICVQMAGRSTRHETDHSVTVVMDPNFSRVVNRLKTKLPQSFLEALVWSGSTKDLKCG